MLIEIVIFFHSFACAISAIRRSIECSKIGIEIAGIRKHLGGF